MPENILIEGLKPDTSYRVIVGGINIYDARENVVQFRTYP